MELYLKFMYGLNLSYYKDDKSLYIHAISKYRENIANIITKNKKTIAIKVIQAKVDNEDEEENKIFNFQVQTVKFNIFKVFKSHQKLDTRLSGYLYSIDDFWNEDSFEMKINKSFYKFDIVQENEKIEDFRLITVLYRDIKTEETTFMFQFLIIEGEADIFKNLEKDVEKAEKDRYATRDNISKMEMSNPELDKFYIESCRLCETE